MKSRARELGCPSTPGKGYGIAAGEKMGGKQMVTPDETKGLTHLVGSWGNYYRAKISTLGGKMKSWKK